MKRYSASAARSAYLFGIATLLVPAPSNAQAFNALVNFSGTTGPVTGTLLQATDGNFYGVTGANSGTIARITPGGALTTLYRFCSQGGSCNDGIRPVGGLIQATDGNFYGVTDSGGASGWGTVFKVTPAGAETILYSFCAKACADGKSPWAKLVQGSDGNFYGTTTAGGTANDGTVFKITPAGVLTTLYSFLDDKDGATPYGGLIQGTDGNFYGTTSTGGANNGGTVYKLTPGGTLTTIYSLVAATDGFNSQAGLVQAKDGNFYGTTAAGGANYSGKGTAFRITPSGAFTVLHTFCAQGDCSDGARPYGGLIQATDDNLYGTTNQGGTSNQGTLFRVTVDAALTTLVNFNQTNGATPSTYAALMQATDGNLYGSTLAGGVNNAGIVFRLQLAASAPYICTNTLPPTIASIDSASAYGGYPYFASGSWLEIKGANLADPADPRLTAATNPGQWALSDFNGSNAPTTLDGISVSINGKPASVWYLSPTQINVEAPEDSAIGNPVITVTNCGVTSGFFFFPKRALAPGLLAPSNYTSNGTPYMVATFASDGAYVLSTGTGAAFGLNSRPAKPGDVIIAYGIGFGDVTPSILPGVIAQQSNALVNPVTISFGSTKASVTYAGLAGGFVGLYEFYITVPPGLANGDYQINVTQNGSPVPQTMYLTVHN